jgi:predicted DNA-binding transcriptional regulator YafY
MSRTSRLFSLLQSLRIRRRPVTAAVLAEELGVSVRSVYRDIDSLRALGASVEGEAGVGFVLSPGFMLPPLMLNEDELDALALGALWVSQRGDADLAAAARHALGKIGAVLPVSVMQPMDAPALVTAARAMSPPDAVDVSALRGAIRGRRRVTIRYADAAGRASQRTLWPVAIAYFDDCRLLAAWCEKREAFRHFRIDRIRELQVLAERYPVDRARLVRQWRAQDPMTGLAPDRN